MPKSLSLPPLYYVDHFREMVAYAVRVHGPVLNDAEKTFITDFSSLDISAQCLYIRMYNRTKPIFHLNDLLYDEIGTCDAIEELIQHGFLRPVGKKDYRNLLSTLLKPKLIELSKIYHLNGLKSSWRKDDIVTHFYSHLSYDDFTASLDDLHYYIPLRMDDIARFKKWWKPRFDKGFYEAKEDYNPDQIYVVVDVETTGMTAPAGRVTEIGAVKVQNGQVIAEWSSLINPDAYIPPFITDITGISNDMVKDAPRFHAIAAEFEDFMGDAIFVAHNVNFDYAFIAAELKRVGRPLHKTKLCTVTSMREYYPGHGSYSLANLCKEYAIPLTTHHRALCDAHAAAQLLMLVNQRRQQLSSQKDAV